MIPVHVSLDEKKPLMVLGTPIAIRVHGAETNGTVCVIESRDLPGGGPPPHVHGREDETFQVLEGEYEFSVGGKTLVAREGSTIFAPRGVPHAYRYVGKSKGRLMCVISPAGFEKFFERVDAMSAEEQRDIPRVVALGKEFGMEILGA